MDGTFRFFQSSITDDTKVHYWLQITSAEGKTELYVDYGFWETDEEKGVRCAFSLVELMVVIVIIGMLAGVVTVSVCSYLIRSQQNVAKLEISKMMQAMETFYATYDRYPTNEEGLAILAKPSEEFPDGLLTFIPDDPWNHAFE